MLEIDPEMLCAWAPPEDIEPLNVPEPEIVWVCEPEESVVTRVCDVLAES